MESRKYVIIILELNIIIRQSNYDYTSQIIIMTADLYKSIRWTIFTAKIWKYNKSKLLTNNYKTKKRKVKV